jgi:hypothetical protein
MARQLSEQLEREVNADELLKTQSKVNSGSSAANAAPKIADTPNVAGTPNVADTPDVVAPNPSIAPPAATSVAENAVPATPPEPLYGLSAAATTAAAMHASDPKTPEPPSATAEPRPTHD